MDIDNILKNEGYSYLDKIVRIKALIGNDTILNDIYNQNEGKWYKDITDVLQSYPPYGEKTITKVEAESINKNILDASTSRLEKIVNVYPFIGKDQLLQNIYDQYPKTHISMIKNYIDSSIPNDKTMP